MLKKTIQTIRNCGHHYLIKVKADQRMLFEQFEQVCGHEQPLSRHESSSYTRGREEYRRVEVFSADKEANEKWTDLKSFIRCTRYGRREGQQYESVSYYMSDLSLSACAFSKGIRYHWSIENCLHWVKDVVFKEDKSRIRKGNGPAAMSMLRSFAISLLAQVGHSTTEIIRMLVNKPKKILQLIE